MKQTTEEKILDTLEKILKVLSLQIAPDKLNSERINLLKLAGLDNKTIASVLNTTEATVRMNPKSKAKVATKKKS